MQQIGCFRVDDRLIRLLGKIAGDEARAINITEITRIGEDHLGGVREIKAEPAIGVDTQGNRTDEMRRAGDLRQAADSVPQTSRDLADGIEVDVVHQRHRAEPSHHRCSASCSRPRGKPDAASDAD